MAKLNVDRALRQAKAHQLKGDLDQARALYDQILEAFPKNSRAKQALEALLSPSPVSKAVQNPSQEQLNALMALYHQGQLAAAAERAAALTEAFPGSFVLWNILGAANLRLRRLDAAIEGFQRASELKPADPDTHYNVGVALEEHGNLEEAIAAYQRALAIKPDYAEAHYNMGNALKDQGEVDEAIAAYQRAQAIKPDYSAAEAQMLHQMHHVCDWHKYDQLCSACDRLGISTDTVSPFAMLAMEDNAERQMLRSQIWARKQYKQAPLSLPAKPVIRPERLRIGYFSADFHNFPGMYLMAGMLEQHDRANFEVYAFSYGPNKIDAMRERINCAVDEFVDIRTYSTDDAVSLSHKYGIDIAIHRNGYTQNSRSKLFSRRLAPIQMNYLGYPGTMGADFIDYIIADPTVIPADQRAFYAEKVIYLPNTYQPNDDARGIAQTTTTRADFGLPENGVVFCCFNNNYKISPHEFDIWMRLLSQVEGSVLWLLKSNKWAEPNLRREADVHGVDPSRLVFADWLSHSEHLARHKHADLFIDTFNYNAHTTASDALWAGLPVVTKVGQQFAARVSASLLTAVGLPELITTTEAEYEALIFELATNQSKLSEIRAKLETNRHTHPLFDTSGYTRDFERGLQEAYKRYFDGQAPADIWIQ